MSALYYSFKLVQNTNIEVTARQGRVGVLVFSLDKEDTYWLFMKKRLDYRFEFMNDVLAYFNKGGGPCENLRTKEAMNTGKKKKKSSLVISSVRLSTFFKIPWRLTWFIARTHKYTAPGCFFLTIILWMRWMEKIKLGAWFLWGFVNAGE